MASYVHNFDVAILIDNERYSIEGAFDATQFSERLEAMDVLLSRDGRMSHIETSKGFP